MKRVGWLLCGWAALFTVCLMPAKASGLGRWNSSRCGCWHAEVDGLYWKPFGAKSCVGLFSHCPEGKTKRHRDILLVPDYNWGVRLQGSYMFPCSCLYLAAEYTYLGDTTSVHHFLRPRTKEKEDHLTDDLMTGPLFRLDTVHSKLDARSRIRYNGVDLVVGNYVVNACNFWGALFAGGRYVSLEDKVSVHLHPSKVTVEITEKDKSKTEGGESGKKVKERKVISDFLHEDRLHFDHSRRFSGGGPLIGVEGHYCICPGLQISGRLGLALLIGDRRLKVRHAHGVKTKTSEKTESAAEEEAAAANEPETVLAKAEEAGEEASEKAVDRASDERIILDGKELRITDINLGRHTVAVPSISGDIYAAYGLEWGCTCISFKLGYAFRSYIDVLATWDQGRAFCSDQTQTVSFAGPYVGIGLTF